MDNNRYKELKQENNIKVKQLSDSYQKIGNAYLLKARGYAIKDLDTEARIKDVLDELSDFDFRGVSVNIAIPNMTEYIETKVKLLAENKKNTNTIKTVIFSTIFIAIIVGFIALGLWLRSSNYLATPSNLSATKASNNEISFTWDNVENATMGYTVWYDNQTPISVDTNIYVFNLDPNKSYTFYVYANDILTGEGESQVFMYYRSKTASFDYSPNEGD